MAEVRAAQCSSVKRQKLRKAGKKKTQEGGLSDEQREKNSRRLRASGKFRKTTGYFKKMIRSQMNAKFNAAIMMCSNLALGVEFH